MNQADEKYSTQKITPQLLGQIVEALHNKAYGSVEIYVENYRVIQITQRTITKLNKIRVNGNGKRIIQLKVGRFSQQKTSI